MDTPLLSFVIPVRNEQATIRELFNRIAESVSVLGHTFEVIFVDDGSDDGSWDAIHALVLEREPVAAIRLRRNLGKAAALAAGFRATRGEIVFTLDADLQDDPREIGRFLDKLALGYDVVCGWKRVRHDPWHKVLPSRIFNSMVSRLTKTPLHDHNCGFKCYRRGVVKELAIYGEMHRMIPALASMRGFRSTEIVVTHHPRRFGRSKYGLSRFFRGFMDMLTVAFLQSYRERPLHAMGAASLGCLALGTPAVIAGCSPRFGVAGHSLEIIGGALIMGAVPLLGVGFLSELLISMFPSVRAPLPIAQELPCAGLSAKAKVSMLGDLRPVDGDKTDDFRRKQEDDADEWVA